MAAFCRILMPCFLVIFVVYFLHNFEMVPVARVVTSVTLFLHSTMCCIAVVKSAYFKTFSVLSVSHV